MFFPLAAAAAVSGGGAPASASLSMATVLDVLSILSLPGGLDGDGDAPPTAEQIAQTNANLQILVPKLFKKYDKRVPSHYPVEVLCYMIVDHIEELNELQQSLTFQATIILQWEDRRLAWEPRDYGNLKRLTFTALDLNRFWTPSITAKGITMMSRHLMHFHNTVYTLTKDGTVFADVSTTLRAACRVDLDAYPHDNQTCFVNLFSPLYSSSQVTFNANPAFLARGTFFADVNMTMTAGYELTGLDAQRFYAYNKGFTTDENAVAANAVVADTLVRYQLHLRRNAANQYFTNIALPLFVAAVLTFIGAQMPGAPTASVLWLCGCVALQLHANANNLAVLPTDYDSEPACVKLARILLVETFLLLIYRLAMTLQRQSIAVADATKPPNASCGWPYRASSLDQLECALRYALVVEAVLFAWILFDFGDGAPNARRNSAIVRP